MSIENFNLFEILIKKIVWVYTNRTHHDEATDEKSGTSTIFYILFLGCKMVTRYILHLTTRKRRTQCLKNILVIFLKWRSLTILRTLRTLRTQICKKGYF